MHVTSPWTEPRLIKSTGMFWDANAEDAECSASQAFALQMVI